MLNLFKKSRLVQKDNKRNLYKTRFGEHFWLDPTKYLDQCIIETGYFEEKSTALVKQLLKTDDIVLDVGANIGYYSVLMSRLVSGGGKVLCFEPTRHYREILFNNIKANNLSNCQVFEFGLSNSTSELDISIGDCSATLHWVNEEKPTFKETIKLKKLDDIFPSLGVERLDFIKVDIDGHEPAFLEGAWETINRYNPIVFLEVSHEHYLDYGITAWDFYELLKSKGLYIYWEDGLVEFTDKRDFLRKCGNFAYSANIFISKRKLAI